MSRRAGRSYRSATARQRRITLRTEHLERKYVLDSTVVFNEIMYHAPDDSGGTLEWIELYNQLAVDMDISDWVLDGGVHFTFPDGTVVPRKGYLVVAADPAAMQAATGFQRAIGPFTGRLSNGGEELRLLNNDNRLMNTLDYRDGGDWPVGPDGSGTTLSKRLAETASEAAANWVSSVEIGGTPGAFNFEPTTSNPDLKSIFDEGVALRALVPTDDSLGTSWIEPGFNDAAWMAGTAGVGYDRNTTYLPFINLDVRPQMDNINESVYIRVPFDVDVDPATEMDSLVLRMKYDDGFVAYINGVRVTADNDPTPLNWDSGADGLHSDSLAVTFVDFDITQHKNVLVQGGNNVLAIHGLNAGLGSSDMLISPALSYTEPPDAGEVPGGFNPTVVFNEILPGDSSDFWVELTNVTGKDLNLNGMVLAADGLMGGTYTFGDETLSPGELLVVDEARLGFRAEDGDNLFLYKAGQTELADARSVTGRLRGRADARSGQWLYPSAATPGVANTFQFQSDVLINEIMYHAPPQLESSRREPYQESTEEWIELYNRGQQPVDLTDWSFDDAINFDFPANTILQPGEYLVVTNDTTALSAKYPGIRTIGDFNGVLNNRDDRILLRDAAKNPADEVHYYERGKWAELADGGGSTLELRDPTADNSNPAAWAASDEASKSEWTTFQFSGVANEPLNCCGGFNEFIFGLLDSGEFLIDDVSLIRQGTATELIQNGSFQGDQTGASPADWRLIGTHSGRVVTDSENAGNRVLHVVASGPQQYVHDHAETTFAGNASVVSNATYDVSFRAKWLGGSRQLNTRLYFTRMSNTVQFAMPDNHGTPGAQNSTFVANLGPTYQDFGHGPVLPSTNEAVTVSVRADDPDGVANMTLWWMTERGGWNTVAMTAGSGGRYTGVIPGQGNGTIVRFYVEGQDALGATSTFPAAGQDAWAMYQVDGDGQETPRPIDTFRLVIPSSVNSFLRTSSNVMSNAYQGTTLVFNGETAFYDVDVRLVGSRFIRPNSGYKVRLHPDENFYGVHDSLRFDVNQLQEILFKQMVNRAGGSSTSLYDDISFLVAPSNGGTMLLNLARYEDVFLDEQFENGGDGTKFELDDITFPTNASPHPEGLKTGTGVSSPDMQDRGGNPEAYRGHLLIKNNRALDDYESIVRLSDAINKNGAELHTATQAVMDVDLWMRHYATQSFLGNWDTYGFRRPKNLRIYVRPEDNKLIPLYWDADLANLSEPFIFNGGVSRLDEIRDIPQNLRLFWGHMWDLTNRSFNDEYVARWAAHYSSLGAGTGGLTGNVGNRETSARSAAISAIPQVPFRLSTRAALDVGMSGVATIAGNGWIDVRQIRLAGEVEPLDVTWTSVNAWQAEIPVAFGTNTYVFEAYDFEGNLIDAAPIDITSSLSERPLVEFLRVTELMYHPTNPTPDEIAAGFDNDDDFEYLELTNIGPNTLDLTDARFTAGISFDFSGGGVTMLAPGEHVLIVENEAAFAFRYGDGLPVAGMYTGKLDNGGERLRLEDATGATILDFVYDDLWHPTTDGDGKSLVIVDATADPATAWSEQDNWRASSFTGGSPGETDPDTVPGDTDGDGDVDIDDLNAVRNNFGGMGAGDTDGDGDVDIDDLNNVRNNFGVGGAALRVSTTAADLLFERSYATLPAERATRRPAARRASLLDSSIPTEATATVPSIADASLESRLARADARLRFVRHLPARLARQASRHDASEPLAPGDDALSLGNRRGKA